MVLVTVQIGKRRSQVKGSLIMSCLCSRVMVRSVAILMHFPEKSFGGKVPFSASGHQRCCIRERQRERESNSLPDLQGVSDKRNDHVSHSMHFLLILGPLHCIYPFPPFSMSSSSSSSSTLSMRPLLSPAPPPAAKMDLRGTHSYSQHSSSSSSSMTPSCSPYSKSLSSSSS